jgi:transposase-like protein
VVLAVGEIKTKEQTERVRATLWTRSRPRITTSRGHKKIKRKKKEKKYAPYAGHRRRKRRPKTPSCRSIFQSDEKRVESTRLESTSEFFWEKTSVKIFTKEG